MGVETVRLRVDAPATPIGYEILCGRGLLADLPIHLHDAGVTGRIIVIDDTTVAPLHGPPVKAALRRAGYDASSWSMPAGETHKTLSTVQDAYAWLAEQRVERRDTVVALGGGVVGDLAGFVAATYLRGLRLVQIPTTLVAQVDSAVGGKVGVDLPAGKNLVGAFHQPALVLADSDTLATLPDREWRAGLAEVIKHGIIHDGGLLDLLESEPAPILGREHPDVIAALVARAVAVKVDVVREDPLETGVRRILNYGHTLGHAIERVAGYGVVRHGEAVAWGMAAAARIGRRVGTCQDDFAGWQDALLQQYGLLRRLPPLDAAELIAATRLDKKSSAGRISWVLPRRPGEVVLMSDVPAAAVRSVVEWLVSASRRLDPPP